MVAFAQLVAVKVRPAARCVQIGRIAVDQLAARKTVAGEEVERIAVDDRHRSRIVIFGGVICSVFFVEVIEGLRIEIDADIAGGGAFEAHDRARA